MTVFVGVTHRTRCQRFLSLENGDNSFLRNIGSDSYLATHVVSRPEHIFPSSGNFIATHVVSRPEHIFTSSGNFSSVCKYKLVREDPAPWNCLGRLFVLCKPTGRTVHCRSFVYSISLLCSVHIPVWQHIVQFEWKFSHRKRTRDSSNSALKGPTQPPVQWVAGVQRPERGVYYPSLSSAEAEEE